VTTYYAPHGGLPAQTELTTDRAVFTQAYAVLPRRTMTDIVTSHLPFWDGMRMWLIARPLSGFAETFSQYIVEVAPGGGSDRPETDPGAEAVLFVVDGTVTLAAGGPGGISGADTRDGTGDDPDGVGSAGGMVRTLTPGGYAYLPPGTVWSLRAQGPGPARFHWIRKAYQRVEGLDAPEPFVTSEREVEPVPMPGTDGRWATTRFVDAADMRHDMHVNVVSFQPGAAIPFPETHVMEHGLYVLEGKAVYLLNRDWVEVEAGDFMWLRAFCPQACYAGGPGPFRYLLYKDVNRHAPLPG
jgi:(S)-ureidoglycine aminohydrolase